MIRADTLVSQGVVELLRKMYVICVTVSCPIQCIRTYRSVSFVYPVRFEVYRNGEWGWQVIVDTRSDTVTIHAYMADT